MIAIDNNLARVTFRQPFDLAKYRLFLRCKALPESQIAYDRRRDAYTITTPARFAALLGVASPQRVGDKLPYPDYLRDYQRWVIDLALESKRFAAYLDTGLGKMVIGLEWSRQVLALKGGRVLILVPTIELIDQYHRETARFYASALPIEVIPTRAALATWCQEPGQALGICTYAKFADGRVDELRFLAGLVADEASILKTKGGAIKWAVMHSGKGIEYKLNLTATPAPNEPMEYASQAGHLEKLNNGDSEIWAYFSRKARTQEWVIKPHAKPHFYRWMASWSVYMRDPAAFGFADVLSDLPAPELIPQTLPLTDEQRDLMFQELGAAGVGMIVDDRLPMPLRIKLAQIARGFRYGDNGQVTRLPSHKVDYVVDSVIQDAAECGPVLVWTVFDEEAVILQARLAERQPDLTVGILDGGMTDAVRAKTLVRFLAGDLTVLISKPSLIGYGLNLQHVKAMIFNGFDDSFERLYQATRRAVRPGQTDRVRVRIPYIRELEGVVYDNIRAKETRFLAEVAIQEQHYRRALQEIQ